MSSAGPAACPLTPVNGQGAKRKAAQLLCFFPPRFCALVPPNVTTLKYLRALVGLGVLVGACGSAEDERPADWDYIAPAIIIPNCATSSCHSEAAAVAGLDMSTPDKAYQSLLGTKAGVKYCGDFLEPPQDDCMVQDTRFPRALVVPGNPSQSRTVNMMRARGAERMPPDRPLAEGDIELVERWILEGAER